MIASIFIGTLLAAARPLAVTTGEAVPPPDLTGRPYVTNGVLESIAVPLTGWQLMTPTGSRSAAPGGLIQEGGIAKKQESKDGEIVVPGIRYSVTNVLVRGVEKPALRIEYTQGSWSREFCWLRLPFALNASEYNLLSFTAKMEVPPKLDRTIGDSRELLTGWFAGHYHQWFDNFAIAIDDGNGFIHWSQYGVFHTDFKNHDIPATRGPDGFTDFLWDMKNEEHTSYKGFFRRHGEAIELQYDTRKIPAGETVVLTIADMKVTRGAHLKFDESERYAAWCDWVANYKPDSSDSSAYLQPPKEGRVLWPKTLAKDGKAQAEIIVDLSDDVLIPTNYTAEAIARNFALRMAIGNERVTMRRAGQELAKWLKNLTDADFEIVAHPTDKSNVKIYLGAGFARKHFPEDLKALSEARATDGFAVRTKGNGIYIFGARPAGTLFGVFAFVENNSDLIWAVPNDPDGTVFTKMRKMKAVWADAREIPAFVQRGWQANAEEWKMQNRCNFYASSNDSGQFRVSGGHYLCPQYYDTCAGLRKWNALISTTDEKGYPSHERPEFWSEYRCLACLSDPEFIKHAKEVVPNVAEIRYNLPLGICVFGTDDNLGVCECPKCTAPRRLADGTTVTPQTDWVTSYGAWFYDYLNRLDAEIQKVWPGFITSTYGYFFGAEFPKIKLSKNIVPWLCTYPRRAQNEPIFAPLNQNWWRIYKDWAKHTDQLFLYDYYGLGFYLAPKAEVHKFDLLAQRDIGFLGNSTEGMGYNSYMGVSDERWCISRLEWNPELDVEQLHRYFNRRTYREAAPWIDKFRGRIREVWYKTCDRASEFCENREEITVIRDAGIENELLGYLDEALKAVKNEKSKRLVERMKADFTYYLNEKGGDFPSRKMLATQPKPPQVKPVVPAELAFNCGEFAKTNGAAALLTKIRALGEPASRLFADNDWESFLSRNAIPALIAADSSFTAKDAMDLYRELNTDDFARLHGWSVFMNGPWGAGIDAIHSISQAFERRGSWKDVARVYMIWADWDGARLPVSLQTVRLNQGVACIRGNLKRVRQEVDNLMPQVEKRPNDAGLFPRLGEAQTKLADLLDAETEIVRTWRPILSRCSSAGSNSRSRGEAAFALLEEEWDRTPAARRAAALEKLIFDEFMPNQLREKAVKKLPAAWAENGTTNWTAVATTVEKALAAGDWSNLGRASYSRQCRSDLQLNALCSVAEDMIAQGEKAQAKELLEKGAATLGYTARTTFKDERNCNEQGMAARLKLLDDTMAKCGAVRK